MAQPQADCNAIDTFFDAFSGYHLFRAVLQGTNKGRNFYGEFWQFEPELRALNAEGWAIYFCANDPGSAYAKTSAFTELRAIYQDAEPGKTTDVMQEPEIAGQQAHFVVETSPGRLQRWWLTDPIPAAQHRFIHKGMVEWHGHDHACATGPAQVMRAPGFVNHKPEYDKPLVRILHDRSHQPRLTLAAVARYFAFPDEFARSQGNEVNAMQRIQSAGPVDNVVQLDQTRARRQQAVNHQVQQERQQEQLRGVPASAIALETILGVLALLNPSMGRNEWRKVGGALHFMSQGADWGFDLFETWSGLGENYKGSFDCEALWRGLKLDAKTMTHWVTLLKMSGQVKPGETEQARLRSAAFDGLRRRLDTYLDMHRLEVNFTERKRGADGFTMELERNSKENCECLLRDLGISARWDEFGAVVRLNGESLTAAHIAELHATAFDQGWKPTRPQLTEFLEGIARQSSYNPAQEFLHGLRGKWDGRPRLETVFIRHLGAPDRISARELGKLFMYAAVRRIHEPGYKFDLMPILQGKQGLGKSSLFRLLCPNPEWFLDSVRLDLEEKRLYAQIQGKLFVEFGELSGKKNAEVEKIKAFVTQQTDEYVANYATAVTSRKRVAVFVGTTNERRFLRDLTGNRRFPVVPVEKELDFEALLAERDQLWAEAVCMEELEGDLRFSPEAEADMREVQADRMDRDVTVEDIFLQINEIEHGFVHRDQLWSALGYSSGKDRDKKLHANARFALNDLEKMLYAAGWTMQETTRYENGVARGHSRRPKEGKLREIVYTGSQFLYRSDITDEALTLLE